MIEFENPIEVLPGDELVTNCIIDTSASSLSKVNFGPASENEMCLVAVWQYPSTNIILGDSEIPFSLCSYAFPKFKDSSKYFAICGSFTQNKLVSTVNDKMGPHDNCNDLNRKFDRE